MRPVAFNSMQFARPCARLSQAAPQFGPIPSAVPDSYNLDLTKFIVDDKINGMRPRSRHFGFSGQAGCQWKSFGIACQRMQELEERVIKLNTDSRLAVFIPVNRFSPIHFCLRLRDDFKSHLRGKRCRISAAISSIGVPRPGLANASSARRSSSAACSDVKSNSSKRASAISRRSSAGNSRALAKISVALIFKRILGFRLGGKLVLTGRIAPSAS